MVILENTVLAITDRADCSYCRNFSLMCKYWPKWLPDVKNIKCCKFNMADERHLKTLYRHTSIFSERLTQLKRYIWRGWHFIDINGRRVTTNLAYLRLYEHRLALVLLWFCDYWRLKIVCRVDWLHGIMLMWYSLRNVIPRIQYKLFKDCYYYWMTSLGVP